MSDFKAPDVVWIADEWLFGVATAGIEWQAVITSTNTGDKNSYTLTTTAEANTRKAVREALEKVNQIIDGAEHIDDALARVDQLLTQYQEVAS